MAAMLSEEDVARSAYARKSNTASQIKCSLSLGIRKCHSRITSYLTELCVLVTLTGKRLLWDAYHKEHSGHICRLEEIRDAEPRHSIAVFGKTIIQIFKYWAIHLVWGKRTKGLKKSLTEKIGLKLNSLRSYYLWSSSNQYNKYIIYILTKLYLTALRFL